MPRIVAGAFGRRAPRNDEDDRETFPTRRDVEDAHAVRASPLIPLMTLANGAGEGAVDDKGASNCDSAIVSTSARCRFRGKPC